MSNILNYAQVAGRRADAFGIYKPFGNADDAALNLKGRALPNKLAELRRCVSRVRLGREKFGPKIFL